MINKEMYDFVMKSFIAGIMIGFGVIIYIYCKNHYVGSFLFALGLMTIIVKEYYLYTGKVGDWVPKTTLKLIAMFLINALGIFICCYLFTFTRLDFSYAQSLAEIKLNDSYMSMFILGIGCGTMMNIAYFGYKKTTNPIFVIMPIMLFILGGFEHCVADVGYLTLAKTGISFDIVLRIAIVVLGNAFGSFILSKIVK